MSVSSKASTAPRRATDPGHGGQVLGLLREKLGLSLRGEALLILNPDAGHDQPDARASLVLDVLDSGEIVLAQTQPPLLKSMTGAPLELSAVVRGDEGPYRVGLAATLAEVRSHRISREVEEVVVLVRLNHPLKAVQANARCGVRVELDSQSRVGFTAKTPPLVPLNISLGGVGFHAPKGKVTAGQKFDIGLVIQGRTLPVRVEAVRVKPSTFRHDYVGAKFVMDEGPAGASWGRLRPALQAALMSEQARQICRLRGED